MTETSGQWMPSIQHKVLCEGKVFVFRLVVLFASYYNVNLQYQHDAACTLELLLKLQTHRGGTVNALLEGC